MDRKLLSGLMKILQRPDHFFYIIGVESRRILRVNLPEHLIQILLSSLLRQLCQFPAVRLLRLMDRKINII